ncbi:MAG: hypothetical protein K2L02_06980 [Clostridia bacterium]|nr:hypothetical protein [Clostridia bacterium]
MLKVLGEGDKYLESCALLLGGFDGFHLGHSALLNAAKQTGLPVGLMTISGGKAGSDIFTLAEREVIFDRAGFSFVWEIEFTKAFQNTSAEDFLHGLFEKIAAKAVFCGEDFRFGKGAYGTIELLKKLAPCPVNILPLEKVNGKKVSATEIKNYLAEGQMREVNRLLSSDFFLQGIVERGRGVGHTYGFPTLNVSYPKEKFALSEGVYGGYAETDAGRYPSVINFGARPTFGVEEKKVEAYLKGFSGDLYETTVRIFPTEFLRPIQKFSSEEELKNQLKKDIQKI